MYDVWYLAYDATKSHRGLFGATCNKIAKISPIQHIDRNKHPRTKERFQINFSNLPRKCALHCLLCLVSLLTRELVRWALSMRPLWKPFKQNWAWIRPLSCANNRLCGSAHLWPPPFFMILQDQPTKMLLSQERSFLGIKMVNTSEI